jgi:threonine dehydrogenase-like Zn-dependent dehydrogenase
VRITSAAICGTDLHMVRGTMTGMEPGTVLGHEAVGVVEEVGPMVRNFEPGDRVIALSTIACGCCSYCRTSYFAGATPIFPTGWFGADLAEIKACDTVAVLDCGPVGQFAIASAKLMNAGRIIAVDRHRDHLRDTGWAKVELKTAA